MNCQSCNGTDLIPIVSLGDIPSANVMTPDSPRYPANVIKCKACSLVQLDTIVDPALIFPPDYPYTSGTTKSLRENFADLASRALGVALLRGDRSVLDIGSNDGSLLDEFQKFGWRVHGVEPTDQALKSRAKGIQTTQAFFNEEVSKGLGKFDVVTATNVFAHIADIHSALWGVRHVLKEDGVFVTESTYWGDTLSGLQWDTIYHEHLRYYTLTSLSNLIGQYGLVPFHVERIPTMGGSIRVFAAYDRDPDNTVGDMLTEERSLIWAETTYRDRVQLSNHQISAAIPAGTWGIGAPSRATTMIHYLGLDDGIIPAICEIKGSQKIGKYMPGTLIPVVDEERLYEEQPPYACLFSWHLADELIPIIRGKGYRGKFIVPLPTPTIR